MAVVIDSKVKAEILGNNEERVLEFLRANSATKKPAEIKIDYEFLAINFDGKYWEDFAKEVAELREEPGEEPGYRAKKATLSDLIYNGLIRCERRSSESALVFKVVETPLNGDEETDAERRIRLETALKFAFQGDAPSSVVRIMIEMAFPDSTFFEVSRCLDNVGSMSEAISRVAGYLYKPKRAAKKDRKLEAEKSFIEPPKVSSLGEGKEAIEEDELGVDGKESKEKEEQKKNREQMAVDNRKAKEAVCEWYRLCWKHGINAFDYVNIQAKALGLTHEEISESGEITQQFEAILRQGGTFSFELMMRHIAAGAPASWLLNLKIGGVSCVSSKDQRGCTALIETININKEGMRFSNSVELVKALLAAGADANARDAYGGCPLVEACGIGYYMGKSSQQRARAEMISALLEGGADANLAEPRSGITPLMEAVQNGDVGTIKLLLSKGNAVDTLFAKDREGRTALDFVEKAARWRSDREEVVALLREEIQKKLDSDKKKAEEAMQEAVRSAEPKPQDLSERVAAVAAIAGTPVACENVQEGLLLQFSTSSSSSSSAAAAISVPAATSHSSSSSSSSSSSASELVSSSAAPLAESDGQERSRSKSPARG